MDGHTLLLVDSDPEGRQSLARSLRERGCRLLEAGGVIEAQELSEAQSFNVALVDLRTLREEGVALVRALHHRQPRCRIIVLAPRFDMGLVIQAMRLGAFDDHSHPVDVEHLLAAIRRALGPEAAKPDTGSGSPDYGESGAGGPG